MRQCGSVVSKFQAQIFSLKGAIAGLGVYWASGKLKDVVMTAARYETLGIVMDQVGKTAGYNSKELGNLQKALQATGISMTEARNNITRMMQANLDLSDATKLARVAQDAAVIANVNSSEAFQRLVYAIQSGQSEILRNMGLTVSFDKAYSNLAKTLGKTKEQLTENQKTQARANATLESGKSIVGVYEAAMTTAGKAILSFERYIEDWKVTAGEAFGPALVEVLKEAKDQIELLTKETAKWVQENKKLIGEKTKEYLDKTISVLRTFKDEVSTIIGIYNSLPEDLKAGIIPGLLMGKFFGVTAGAFVGMMAIINSILSKFGYGLGDLAESGQKAQKAIEDLYEVLKTGKRPGYDQMPLASSRDWLAIQMGITGPVGSREWPTTPQMPKQKAGIEEFIPKKSDITAAKTIDEALRAEFEPLEVGESLNILENLYKNTYAKVKEYKKEYMEFTRTAGKEGYDLVVAESDAEIFAIKEKYSKMISLMEGFAGAEKEVNELRVQQTNLINQAMADKEKKVNEMRLNAMEQTASNMAQTFDYLAESSILSSKDAFAVQKAFAVVEATINTYQAITKALASAPPPWNFALAASVGAMGFAQVAKIVTSDPPSYDEGGISRQPGMYYAGVPEAHIPLPSGGRVPVEIEGSGSKEQTINITNNIVAMDAQSFQEYTAKNPGAIVGPVITALNQNTGLRYSFKELLK